MPVKGDVAAWRARPSGPDSWAGSAVRRMYPASAGVEDEIEEANGSAGAYAPTLPLSQSFSSLVVPFGTGFYILTIYD